MFVSDFATTRKLGWVTALKMSVARKGQTGMKFAISVAARLSIRCSTVYVNAL
jgi:hypothetical protein